jgi:HEPN domain-containing protein
MEMNAWNEGQEEVSLEAMDKMVANFKAARDEYDEKKKIASAAYKEVETIQASIVAALSKAGKKSYKVDGLGTFSIVNKQTVKIPNELEDKRKLFEYIRKTYGDETADSMLSIHSGTLNSFYNQEIEKHIDDPAFHFPGIEAPTVRQEARFTKAK